MQYRERGTTTAVYGFRIDAMHLDGVDKSSFSTYISSDSLESTRE
jgi:hypothetical protein